MPQPSDRICIIGAGAAGLSAAYYLRKKGYQNLVVLEKLGRVGGKCYSIKHGDRYFDMGGLEVGKTYTNVRHLAAEFGIHLTPAPPFVVAFPKKGIIARNPKKIFGNANFLWLLWCFIKYWYLTSFRYQKFCSQPSMVDVPEELLVSASDWFDNEGIAAIKPLFDIIITGYGYGKLDQLPAAYLIKFVSNGSFLIRAALGYKRWPQVVVEGYQTLWERVAKTLPDVRTGVEGIQVERKDGKVVVRAAGLKPETFNAAIVTCCLDDSIGSLIPDATESERTFFSATEYNHYWSFLCEMSAFPDSEGLLVDFSHGEQVESPWAAVKSWPDDNAAVFNGYSRTGDGSDRDEILQNISKDMKRLNIDVGRCVGEIVWKYFPHVSADKLRNRHFERGEEIQGKLSTYYAGSVFNFETVYHTLVYTESMINKHF